MADHIAPDGTIHRSRPFREPWKSWPRITRAQSDLMERPDDPRQAVPPYHRNITDRPGEEMTAAEKQASDNARLPQLKTSLKQFHGQIKINLVEKMSPASERDFLLVLLDDAKTLGLIRRATYIQRLVDWLKTCNQAVIDAETSIDAATRPSDAEAVTVDYSTLEASAPIATVRGAMTITD